MKKLKLKKQTLQIFKIEKLNKIKGGASFKCVGAKIIIEEDAIGV